MDAELHEVRDLAQTTLENIRSLSQALHPVMLDEAGLVCERLSPIEADGEHVLAAAAHPASDFAQRAGSGR